MNVIKLGHKNTIIDNLLINVAYIDFQIIYFKS